MMDRVLLAAMMAASAVPLAGQQRGPGGRWDLTASDGRETWPLWMEIATDPPPGGRFQNRYGHALPIVGLTIDSNRVSFTVPAEVPTAGQPRFIATVEGNLLRGEIVTAEGDRITVTGRRAPSLARGRSPEWGPPVDLLANGLAGWRLRAGSERNGWSYASGELVNTPPSADLISRQTFTDFRLQLEVNVPPGGNSGIYLRGRYEVQVQDDYGKDAGNRRMGGIYGQVAPMSNPARPAGEWQALDITLLGRRVTVVLNGVTIIQSLEIPGITGGALDSDEGEPGPIMLQGDHTGVRYRNIRVVPAR